MKGDPVTDSLVIPKSKAYDWGITVVCWLLVCNLDLGICSARIYPNYESCWTLRLGSDYSPNSIECRGCVDSNYVDCLNLCNDSLTKRKIIRSTTQNRHSDHTEHVCFCCLVHTVARWCILVKLLIWCLNCHSVSKQSTASIVQRQSPSDPNLCYFVRSHNWWLLVWTSCSNNVGNIWKLTPTMYISGS